MGTVKIPSQYSSGKYVAHAVNRNMREFYSFLKLGLRAPGPKLILNNSPMDVLFILNIPKFQTFVMLLVSATFMATQNTNKFNTYQNFFLDLLSSLSITYPHMRNAAN